MNRLQKKCVFATAGIHLLLLTILLVGPAFFNRKPKTDDTQVLDVIPANLIDAAFNSGVKNAQPPAPTPIVTPQPQPTPPAPAPVPTPEKFEKIRPEKILPKPDMTAIEKPTRSPSHTPKVNLHLVTRTVSKDSPTTDNSQNARTIQNAIRNLKRNFSPSTTVDMPGTSSASYANYGDVVVSVYHNAWIPPDGMVSDNVTVIFKVTITNDGTVTSARIITSSGDANVDRAVQKMLDRVTFIAPFPEGATDRERNYTINFNATRISE